MRAGWNDEERNAPLVAQMVQDAGAAAVTVHGRTAAQSYSGWSDWDLIARVAGQLGIPRVRQRRLHRPGNRRGQVAQWGDRRPRSAEAFSATHGFLPRPPIWQPSELPATSH